MSGEHLPQFSRPRQDRFRNYPASDREESALGSTVNTMLRDKRKDLDAEKQKRLLHRLVAELSHSDPDLYYRSTSEIAFRLKEYIDGEADLSEEEDALLMRLSRRDIEILLSLN
jgi:hypothetical protein